MKTTLGPALLPVALGLFVVLGLVGILNHEMWRDELEIWLIASSSGSLGQLFDNMRIQGHPALWYLLVFAVSRLSDDPLSMQLLHLAIASCSAALILRYAPFPTWIRALLCFSYFVFYEYTIISRSYGLEFLLAFAFCALYPRREERLPWLAAMLFLMANTNLYGAILAANLGLFVLLEAWWARGRVRYAHAAPVVGSLALFAVGLSLGLGQVVSQSLLVGSAHYGAAPVYDLLWITRSLASVQAGYLPLPEFRTLSFWNTNVLDVLPGLFGAGVRSLLAIVLVGVSSWLLATRRSVLALFWLGAIPMLCITLFVWFGSLRHHGQIFLLFVICCWLHHHARDGGEDRRVAMRERFLAILLAVHCVAGAHAFLVDLRHPFSNAAALGRFLRQAPYADRALVGSLDFAAQPVAAYALRPIFYPESGEFRTFIDWGEKRRDASILDALQAAIKIARQRGEPVLMILNVDPPDLTEDVMRQLRDAGGVDLRYVTGFDGAIVSDENYVLIEVSPTGSP